MADGPWKKYAPPSEAKPWEKYAGKRETAADRIAAAKAGTLTLSPERAAQQAEIDAMATPQQGRSVGQAVYDNLIGDPNDGVDSVGERAGRVVGDVAKAGAAGVARGVAGLAGLPGTVGDLIDAGVVRAGQAVGAIPQGWTAPQSALSSGALVDALGAATGGATDFRAQTTPGKYAGTVGEFLPGAAAFGGASWGNLLRFGVAPGLASEAAGQATEGTPWETAARIGGALAGGILPGMIAKGAARVVSPYGGADPERLKMVKVLEEAGVPLSAGQKVGDEMLRRREGLTGAGQALSEAQREAFTAAALKTAGTDATRATPEVLAETAKRIGAVFDDVVRGVDITPDASTLTALSKVVGTYKSTAPTGGQVPLVSEIFREATKLFRGGNTVPAATVQTWRSNLSKLTASADAATREAAIGALEVIDDMLNSALTTAGRAVDIARLAEARGQWRNFLAIQKAATGAGESAAAGLLSPSQLRSAVVQQGRAAYAQGKRGDLGDLARAGEGVMKALPDSGTPAGMFARISPEAIWAGLGAAGGGTMGGAGAAIGAAMGAMVPAAAGALRMSRPIQNYLANQIVPNVLARPAAGTASGLVPFAQDSRNALRP